ncbi:MAG: hypothetical protein NC898_05590 [Candidatus Omnitrophica bacterium]|nr:hypothetical protein [Candidatus Omnitrophota bacterium]MCM8793915.1 hypothetical protein [Candidatus Omnitrophota bacterium]
MRLRKKELGFCFLNFLLVTGTELTWGENAGLFSQSILRNRDGILRRIKNGPSEKIPEFFKFDPRSKQDPQDLDKLNQGIYNYILKNFGVEVTNPPSPIRLYPTEMQSYGSYRIKQKTLEGEYDIVVKQADDFIKNGFLKASELGIASKNAEFVESKYKIDPVNYTTTGYVISYYFDGKQLSNFVFDVDSLIKNQWIFESLGIKLAILKKEGVEYKERIDSNVLIDIKGRDLRILGYGNFGARDPVEQIYAFIYTYLLQELRKEKKEGFADSFWLIFKNAYNSQLPPEMHIRK